MSGLNESLLTWLQPYAVDWDLPPDEVALFIGGEETRNRLQVYPRVGVALLAGNLPAATHALRKAWALGGQFDAMRFVRFVSHEESAAEAIYSLVNSSPSQAATAINQFVEIAVTIGYGHPKHGPDRSGATLLASTILTAASPHLYVDYRRGRWERLAKELSYPLPSTSVAYGEQVIWAGEFARELAETEAFTNTWGSVDSLWAVAGFCWGARDPRRPLPDPADPVEFGAFSEGTVKRRLHLVRERSPGLIKAAKALRKQTDPDLHCEVCGFSYLLRYGTRGEGFIEAHHRVPLARLTAATKTRIEDLALVCSNCHRMLHAAPEILVDTLRKQLETD